MPNGDVDIAAVPTPPHAVRVMQVLDDFLRRRAAGEPVSEAALLTAHPELADELREHLEIVMHLQPADQHIGDLIAKGILQYSTDARFAAALGPYQIMDLIGRGGMGIVLRAYEPSLNRTVALKILRPDLSHDGTAVTRFQREARAAAALRSPHIVTIHAIGQERGVHYIAMECVDGPSLADLIRQHGPLPADLARHVFRGVLEALRAAHEAGLIHRDIKSSNILLGSPQPSAVSPQPEPVGTVPAAASPSWLRGCVAAWLPSVKLADFGLARMRASHTQVTVDGSVLGTPEYMSPEQARGDAHIDHRTDLYSAGIVLYEMLTGRTPFHADTPTATIRKILDEPPRDPRELDKHVDPVLASLALRLMAKAREDRLVSAAEALAPLNSGMLPVRRGRRRRWCRKALMGAALIGLAVVVCTWSVLFPAVRRPAITAAKIDTEDPRVVRVRRGNSDDFVPLCELKSNQSGTGERAGVANLDGRGSQLVIVAAAPRGSSPDVLFAFAPNGELLWSMALNSDLAAQVAWPDCPETPSDHWSIKCFQAHDVDGRPGDELIVAASDPLGYATRVSIIDPRTREIGSSFWHSGVISVLAVANDYFGPGKPAVIATGVNNKLDGFDEPRDDEPKLTEWDKVPVVMILDPNDMNGLGPPHVNRIPIPPITPWAYAFLDLSAAKVDDPGNGAPRVHVPERKQAQLSDGMGIHDPRAEPGPNGTGSIVVQVLAHDDRHWVALTLNADLTLKSVQPDDNTLEPWPLDEWRRLWHPIIRCGEYVGS